MLPQLFHTSPSRPLPPRLVHLHHRFPLPQSNSMAHHSPSPSSSSSSASSRRLSELLGEQQEPFYLDLYLLEKGCRSPAAFLDAAACGGGGGACSTCWPRARSIAGGRLLRRTARSKKRRPRGGGVLRLLLSKILSGTVAAPAATTAAKKKRLQLAAIDWRSASVDDEEKRRTPGRSTNAGAVPSPSAAVEGQCTEVGEEQEEEDEEEEEDESSSKKQLSPVSVLEQRLFKHSPPPHTQKALVLFSELLEAACTPTTLLHLLANARQYRSRSTDDDGSSSRRRRRSSKNGHNNARRRRELEDDVAFERDLATATALVASEMAGARVRPGDLRPSAQDVGEDIAAAVLDALTEEAAAELALMPDAGGPRLCG